MHTTPATKPIRRGEAPRSGRRRVMRGGRRDLQINPKCKALSNDSDVSQRPALNVRPEHERPPSLSGRLVGFTGSVYTT